MGFFGGDALNRVPLFDCLENKMKLQTSIAPRLDGTVIVQQDGKRHVFKDGGNGFLTCDVDHEPTVARLLASGNFEPVDDADYLAAAKLSEAAALTAALAANASGSGSGNSEDGDDDEFSEELTPGGLPLEANNQPVAKAPKNPKTPKAGKQRP
jgi:hypothetical protein